jgi:hypothetical protein
VGVAAGDELGLGALPRNNAIVGSAVVAGARGGVAVPEQQLVASTYSMLS